MGDSVIICVATRTEEWQDSEDMFCEDDCFCEQTISDISNDFDSLNFKHFSTKIVRFLVVFSSLCLVTLSSVIMDFQMFLK